MRLRAALTTIAAGAVLVAPPTAALAQDVTGDANDLDGNFVPGAEAPAADDAAPADSGTDASADTDDQLPQTGGGLALLGGLAVAGGAAISRRRG